MATPAQKATPKATTADNDSTANTETTKSGPVRPHGLQLGEKVDGPLTTRPARGVNEPASDTVADEPSAAALQNHVQQVIDEETKRGFRGAKKDNDNNPNYNYTLRGVGEGLPTPETTVHTPKG
jgi:hypothetical protein